MTLPEKQAPNWIWYICQIKKLVCLKPFLFKNGRAFKRQGFFNSKMCIKSVCFQWCCYLCAWLLCVWGQGLLSQYTGHSTDTTQTHTGKFDIQSSHLGGYRTSNPVYSYLIYINMYYILNNYISYKLYSKFNI